MHGNVGSYPRITMAPTTGNGTVVTLFQPAEETGDGARGMVEDKLADLIPRPDVAFAQHVLPAPLRRGLTASGWGENRITRMAT